MNVVRPTRLLCRLSAPGQNSATAAIVMAVVVVGVLYFARDVLVPIVLAVLMSFVLAPLIALLQRLRCPRILAVFLVVLAAFSVLFALGGLMAARVNQLASDLPVYQSTLREKIQALRGAATGTGTLERASEVLQSLRKELERPKPDAQTPGPPGEYLDRRSDTRSRCAGARSCSRC